MTGLTVSATELSSYAGFGFCAHCAWVRLHVKPLPWQSFPGIFSSIDRYTKLVVVNHLRREGRLPPWMAPAFDKDGGEADEHIDPPHWSKFKAADAVTGVTLRGEADAIFRLPDGSCAIIDYKTSRYNPDNRSAFRVYRAQLNAYAWIWSRMETSPVSRLALVYMEPATGDDMANAPELVDAAGFVMGFRPRVVEVELAPERLIPPLLRHAARIHALTAPPKTREGCRDCAALEGLLEALGN